MRRCEAGGISEENAVISFKAGGKRVEQGPSWLFLLEKGVCSISHTRFHSVIGSQQVAPSFFLESGEGAIQPFHVEKIIINSKATAESKDAFVRTEKP